MLKFSDRRKMWRIFKLALRRHCYRYFLKIFMLNFLPLQAPQRCFSFRMAAVLMGLVMLPISGAAGDRPARASNVKSAPQRALTLQEMRGKVTYKGGQIRPAQVGDRLVTGQGITTGKQSSAIIAMDSQIGIIKVAENTDLVIRQLSVVNGGSVTLLAVNRGQVALRVRPFTNPASRLEIHTPSGVSGVRGTEFGVAVAPSGRSAILTAEGKVAVSAQGQTVYVKAGYSSMIYPGEAPTPARPTVETVDLAITHSQQFRSGLVQLSGRIDPINAVSYQGQPIEVARDGTFSLQVIGSQSPYLDLIVRTPLGGEKNYQVWFR
jgi:hypothetical protein